MIDYLEAARDRLGGLHDHLSRREVALAADDLHAILSAILDHLEEQQTVADPLDEDNHDDRLDCYDNRWVWCGECDGFRRDGHEVCESGIGFTADGIDEGYGPVAFAPRPAEPDPRDEDNHADRYDRGGERWVWCDGCDGFRMNGHGPHKPGDGWLAVELDKTYGPLTFAPRPAEPDPLDEDNHADRVDRYGTRWVWCDRCGGFRMDGHAVHEPSYGRSAFWIDEIHGPVTFAQ